MPDLTPTLQAWYGTSSTHLWRNAAGRFEEVISYRGFDQGCPLAPAAYSIGQRTVLEPYLEMLLHMDPLAKMYSYLDDTYLVVSKQCAVLALTGLSQELGRIGLELNPSKTVAWSPGGVDALPLELQPHFVPTLPVLGAHLLSPGDVTDATLQLGGHGADLARAGRRLEQLWQRLTKLHKAGLKAQAVAALLKTYAGPASQYNLQLNLATSDEVQAYDTQLVGYWEFLTCRTLPAEAQTRLGLPAKLGGCGVQFASTRRNAAFWGMWTKCFSEVQADTTFTTAADLLVAAPRLTNLLETARAGLVAQGVLNFQDSPLSEAMIHDVPKAQRLLVTQVQKITNASLLASLTPERAAELRGGGGPGAAGFLWYPSEACCSLEDELWRTALRQRLALPRAEYAETQLPSAVHHCHLRAAAHNAPCGHPLDERGFHAMTEQSGGRVLARHNHLAKAVGSLVTRWRGSAPLYDQRVPQWDRPSRRAGHEGAIEHAELDLEYIDDDGRRWIDVTVRHPAAGGETAVRAAARKDGEATRRAERAKHERYPGDRMTPFAVETPGRLGAEARQWLMTQIRLLAVDEQTFELARAYKVLSCAVQRETAMQLRRAAALR